MGRKRLENRESVERFLNTPIAVLEQYGVDIRTINYLEDQYGIYVEGLAGVSPQDILDIDGVAETQLYRLIRAMKKLKMETRSKK